MKFWKRFLAVAAAILSLLLFSYLIFTGQQLVENYDFPTEVIYEAASSGLLVP